MYATNKGHMIQTKFQDIPYLHIITPGAMTGTRAIPSSASEQFKIAFFFSSIMLSSL